MIITDEKMFLKDAVEELRFAAIQDQTFDEGRLWTYLQTKSCPMCGGVKVFLDWIDNKIDEIENRKVNN